MSLKDKAAIVGVGVARADGGNAGLSVQDLAVIAASEALADAGLSRAELDGFAYPAGGPDPGALANQLGATEVAFSTSLTSGSGGGAGGLGLAAAAISGGFCQVCLSIVELQTLPRSGRAVNALLRPRPGAAASAYGIGGGVTPDGAFSAGAGISNYGIAFALTANAYMTRHGITREQLGQVVVRARANAGEELDLADYLASEVLIDPLSEMDAAPAVRIPYVAAVITTPAERAKALQQPPVLISAAVQGGGPMSGAPWQGPADQVASAGHGPLADALYGMAGMSPGDINIALLHDDFSPSILMQLEDYGLCAPGEAASLVASGGLPINTHGGNISEAFTRGETHVIEGVRQLRGVANSQVAGAETVLVTGDPGILPLSAVILRRA